MALKITKASDIIAVERLNMVIYAPPGIGKTSLAFTAEAPLMLDFDTGAHRAANRGDTVQVSQWSDVEGIDAKDLEPFETVIVDTAGRALDVLAADVMAKNPKHGYGGSLSLQGYGALKNRFTAFMKHLNSFGKDVVLIAHMDEQRSGDDIVERLDVQGGSKGEIYKIADAMGRLAIRNGVRNLIFSPTDTAFGKNPAQLDPLTIPDSAKPEFGTFLSDVIAETKAKMNEMTEAQLEAAAEQQWFRDALPKVKDVDGVNALMERAKAGGRATSLMLKERAEKGLGFTYSKDDGGYIDPKAKGDNEPAAGGEDVFEEKAA